MPVPGTAPRIYPDAICPLCSAVLAKKIVSASNGSFDHILFACNKCQYSYKHIPDHLNGDFQAYKVFTGEAAHTKPPGL